MTPSPITERPRSTDISGLLKLDSNLSARDFSTDIQKLKTT